MDETYNDVVHIILLNLSSEVNVNLNTVLGILLLDSMQERVEPFRTSEITNNPCEVNLGQTSGLGVVEVVHAVPDRLQDPVMKT
jgi:hypothetical protein